jgi:hypothetical protein
MFTRSHTLESQVISRVLPTSHTSALLGRNTFMVRAMTVKLLSLMSTMAGLLTLLMRIRHWLEAGPVTHQSSIPSLRVLENRDCQVAVVGVIGL